MMTARTHNSKAGKVQFGSSGDNLRRQQHQAQDPEHGKARDREGRKGGSK